MMSASGIGDSHGNSDFGPIPPGHYTLAIYEPAWNNSDSFEVEIKSLPTPTTSVLIDAQDAERITNDY